MKYGKYDVGTYVSATNPTYQSYYIIQFARGEGFKCDPIDFSELEELSYDELEDFHMLLEEAVEYLNTNCVEKGYVFTFIDTDFRLIGSGMRD